MFLYSLLCSMKSKNAARIGINANSAVYAHVDYNLCYMWNTLQWKLSHFQNRFTNIKHENGSVQAGDKCGVISGWSNNIKFVLMMTSSISRVIGPLCGEFTGRRWIPLTKASNTELRCFLWFAPEKDVWVNNRDAGDVRRHHAHYDITVMLEMDVIVLSIQISNKHDTTFSPFQ